jgi:CheY-like chemotaxis protein
VQVPLAQAAATALAEATGGAVRSARRVQRVLVVDDNRDAADTIATAIELAGHAVAVAYGGEAGLAVADDFRPDCMLLDLGRPGMDGHQLARTLRSHPDHRRCLLVALTGWGQKNDREPTH